MDVNACVLQYAEARLGLAGQDSKGSWEQLFDSGFCCRLGCAAVVSSPKVIVTFLYLGILVVFFLLSEVTWSPGVSEESPTPLSWRLPSRRASQSGCGAQFSLVFVFSEEHC